MVTEIAGVKLDDRTVASIAAYDEHAREYQEALRRSRPHADARRFAALAEPEALVLDGCCGPANDLRLLSDAGLRPVGVDLSFGALTEARMLMPNTPLVQTPIEDLPFRIRVFSGLWLSAAFVHLPRDDWSELFGRLLNFLDSGPVYFSCVRGRKDLDAVDDPILGPVYRSDATEDEIATMFNGYDLTDIEIELRPDPLLDRKRPWVVALGRKP